MYIYSCAIMPLCTFDDSFGIDFFYLKQSLSLESNGERSTFNLYFNRKQVE